jgi:hypothetical protein
MNNQIYGGIELGDRKIVNLDNLDRFEDDNGNDFYLSVVRDSETEKLDLNNSRAYFVESVSNNLGSGREVFGEKKKSIFAQYDNGLAGMWGFELDD